MVGIVPEKRTFSTEDEQWEIDLSDKEIDMELTVTVYSASLKKLAILNTLDRTISAIMLSTIQFFKPLHFLSVSSEDSPVPDVHEEIQKQPSVFGLIIYPSSEGGIGNCFFYSSSRGLLESPAKGLLESPAKGLLESPSKWQPIPTKKDLSLTEETILSLPHKLRLLFVQEISGAKQEHYRSFSTLLQSEYVTETSKFLEDGYYDSCVGNLMPLAMENVLHANFVIFRPCEQHLYVSPEDLIRHGTIFLV